MKISKVTLTNIRCFEHFEVDLNNTQGAKNWMIILGDNAVGKTTVLRSIVLGLAEQSGVSALLAELSGDWVRENTSKGIIRLELIISNKKIAFIETILEQTTNGEVKVEKKISSEGNLWSDLFVCAYGAGRGIYGTTDLSEYGVVDAVYSLFNYKSELQNPELNLRRIQSEINDINPILRKLENVLMVNEGAIELNRSGIVVNGTWGRSIPTGTLSDGYIGTLTWLMDMYGWKLLFDEHMTELEISGVIIIDEIEQHLHPKWQKQIIRLLSEQFPKVQFIVSTHSPLCVIGTTDLLDDECSISVLRQDVNSVIVEKAEPPRGKRADQVLTSYLFDLFTTGDNQISKDIGQYTFLYNKETRTPKEDQKMQDLKNKLSEELGSPETELEKLVESAVNSALESLTQKSLEKLRDSPLNFEVRKQLLKIFHTDD